MDLKGFSPPSWNLAPSPSCYWCYCNLLATLYWPHWLFPWLNFSLPQLQISAFSPSSLKDTHRLRPNLALICLSLSYTSSWGTWYPTPKLSLLRSLSTKLCLPGGTTLGPRWRSCISYLESPVDTVLFALIACSDTIRPHHLLNWGSFYIGRAET